MDFIVVDLEATCWGGPVKPDRMEIIEIGAVRLDEADLRPKGEFGCFVKPIENPVLSDFCTRLTTITQAEVDQAESFPEALDKFLTWAGPEPFYFCSWGAYDLKQFQAECLRHRIEFPPALTRHINLKAEFARLRGARPSGMAKALRILRLEATGTHHRGLDDARNIAEIARIMIPKMDDPEGSWKV